MGKGMGIKAKNMHNLEDTESWLAQTVYSYFQKLLLWRPTDLVDESSRK